MPETTPLGASQGGRERASFRPDAGKGGRARGQGRSLPQLQASPDRMVLAARRGEGRPRCRSQVRGESNGSPYEATDRPRGAALARGGAPRVATRSPRRRQRPSPRGERRSQLPSRADECAVVRAHTASLAAPRTRPNSAAAVPPPLIGHPLESRKPRMSRAFRHGPGRDRTCDLGINSIPTPRRPSAAPRSGGPPQDFDPMAFRGSLDKPIPLT